MENIVFTIVPVRERGMIAAGLLDWSTWAHDLLVFLWGRLTFLTLKSLLVSGLQIHGVGINDFSLFFHVERLFVILDLCLRKFIGIILSVVGEKRLWIGVTHEAIDATCLPCTLIAGR